MDLKERLRQLIKEENERHKELTKGAQEYLDFAAKKKAEAVKTGQNIALLKELEKFFTNKAMTEK